MKEKMKRNQYIYRIWNSDIFLAVMINTVFILSILLFCDIKYEVSDDFVMSAIMSGAYGNQPNPHLIFINILWGYLLLPFYYIFPKIGWYLIFQLLLCFSSLTLVSYMLFQKLDRTMAMMASVLLLTVFGSDAYVLVQFTKTAMLAVMGGGIVFVWSVFERKGLKKTILSGMICLLGTWIRLDVIYIAGGFILFILLVEFVKKLKSRINVKKEIIRIVCSGSILIALAVVSKMYDSYCYNISEDYKFFKEYSMARSAIVDASDYGYEVYEAELKKIGISENDYLMMRKWNFADNKVFNLDIMKKTAKIIVDYKKNVPISKEALLEQVQTRGVQGYPICIACIVITVLGIVFQKNRYWTSFIVWIIGFVYILYFFYIERVLYRIEYAIFLAGFLCILYFWENQGVEICQKSYNFNRICVILTVLYCAVQCELYLPDRSYQDVSSQNRKEYIDNTFYESWNYNACKYRKVVTKGEKSVNLINEVKQNEDNLYLLDFQLTIQTLYYDWKPFEALPRGYFDNCLYLAGITTNYPDCNQILTKYNAEQPLKALVNDNVYLVDSDTRTLNQKVQYLREHYYPNARAELYKEIDGYQIWKLYRE